MEPPMEKDAHPNFNGITLRMATASDSISIWQWRNDDLTRAMSITTDTVSWETHSKWYEHYLTNQNGCLYVGYLNDTERVGMCRFDIDSSINSAEVSINLNPQYRGKHLSQPLLSMAIGTFLAQHKVNLAATIKNSNHSSIKCFSKCGFLVEREDRERIYFRRAHR